MHDVPTDPGHCYSSYDVYVHTEVYSFKILALGYWYAVSSTLFYFIFKIFSSAFVLPYKQINYELGHLYCIFVQSKVKTNNGSMAYSVFVFDQESWVVVFFLYFLC